MLRPYLAHGQWLVRLICLIAVAFAAVFHVHSATASTRLQTAVAAVLVDQGDSDDTGKSAGEICHLCSCCPAFVVAPDVLPAATASHLLALPAHPLVAFRQPTTAPPPRF